MAGDLQKHLTKAKLKEEAFMLPSTLLWDVTIVTYSKRTPANDSLANPMCKHYQDAVKQTVLTDAELQAPLPNRGKKNLKKTKPPLQVLLLPFDTWISNTSKRDAES